MPKKATFTVSSLSIPKNPFTNEEATAIAKAIFKNLDQPCRPSEHPVKRMVYYFEGMAKAGKDRITEVTERFFRGQGFKMDCTPETAEDSDIRREATGGNALLAQAQHFAKIQAQLEFAPYNHDMHGFNRHRGPIDILYWFERDVQKGLYSAEFRDSAKRTIFELLKLDLVDAFFIFTISPEEALRRGNMASLAPRQAKRMSDEDFIVAQEIYKRVLDEIQANVPGLPSFHIDTTHLSIVDASREVLRYLLPTVCARRNIPCSWYLPESMELLQREAGRQHHFEEQLKLRGISSRERIAKSGWTAVKRIQQEDTYLDLFNVTLVTPGAFSQITRIRREEDGSGPKLTYHYKTVPKDRIFSFRVPLIFDLTEEEARGMAEAHPVLVRVKKFREKFRKEGGLPRGHYFTLHIDRIEGMGDFTEIRAFGSPETTHTKELLDLAMELGFTLADIVEGSYIGLALQGTPRSTA